MNNSNKWQPFIYGLLIAGGITIGMLLRPAQGLKGFAGGKNKFSEIFSIINQAYVDTVNLDQLETQAINDMLTRLDPHSVYIPAQELAHANEQLEGNFEGIGVEFNIFHDTIMVVAALNGGPSEALGIQSGDRIVEVDGKKVTNVNITNEQVFKLLRGQGGTRVNVLVYRPGISKKLTFNITRGTIPIHSVDLGVMLNRETGYIKVSRFAANTHEEFLAALRKLEDQGLRNLVLDLRGNPGGYLMAATQIADEFIDGDKLLVYTEGRSQDRKDYTANEEGHFEKGHVIVLIDEGSASASEIVSGTIQDWDRGLIIGRRSFGKGLVQEPFELRDGSALRLTVSRYYTPSGRCIQKTYKEGYEDYENEIMTRFDSGELQDSSKLYIGDSTIYHTAKGRVVYGGGGIIPDIFVPIDTSYNSTFYTRVITSGTLNQFAIGYADTHRPGLKRFGNAAQFNREFNDDVLSALVASARAVGIEAPAADLARSGRHLSTQVKALIARQLWRDEGYFTVMSPNDKVLRRALESLQNYDKLLSRR
jgi:carboxyl-terminal processing protease